MITFYDYLILGCYLLITVATGVLFRRLSEDTSDYFRCGGVMPWWLTGISAWITSFSAWTFTGAAGKVYESGTLVLVSYYGGAVGLLIVWSYSCIRFRRLRVVTYMEAVRLRFDGFTEQFYTWLKLPLLLVFGAIGLNTIGVFMASVFRLDMTTTLVLLGTIVTAVAFLGGAWAVLASDFVQLFLVVTITITVAYLALQQPAIGGLHRLIEKLPAEHFDWSASTRMPILCGWIFVMIFFGIYNNNKLENATLYLMVKSDRDARKMVLIPFIGSLLGPLIWFIPPMVARITHPNLALEYPHLSHPHEAAFVAVSLDVMPKGLLGILLCAMLGATLTNMDAALNKGAGIFVRSFYRPILSPHCSEARLLSIGKACTLVFGALVVGLAVLIDRLRTVGLFDLSNLLTGALAAPLALPLLLGFFVIKTPAWSAWSTVVVGFTTSWITSQLFTPERFEHLMGWTVPLSAREATDALLICTVTTTLVSAGGWFLFTRIFFKHSSPVHRARIEELTRRLDTPVDGPRPNPVEKKVFQLIGGLCLTFGIFILLLSAIPNDLRGRLCFVGCGGAITGAGVLLWRRGRPFVSE